MNINNQAAERRRILELSSPQSSGKTKMKVQLTPVRKIKSKIASKLNSRSFEKTDYFEVDLESNKATCSSGLTEEPTFAVFQHVTITLYYYLDNNQIETIQISIREDNIISDFIRIVLAEINTKLQKENKQFTLNTTVSGYSIKSVKKNGMPKHDLPSYSHHTTIQNCHEEKLALTWNNNNNISNIVKYSDTSHEKKPDAIKHIKKDSKDPKIKKYKFDKKTPSIPTNCIIF